ncbi:MAG: VOC family protein [Polyangiaceae bacterium]
MTDSNIGRFVWYDLLIPVPQDAVTFYETVIGWTGQPREPGYTMFVTPQGPVGGVMALPDQARRMGSGPIWTSFVQVSDVDATIAKAISLGGSLHVPPSDVPGFGRMAVIMDPQGGHIDIVAPSAPLQLHDPSKPGEFVWSELLTTDHEAAFTFYSALFGWQKVRDFDMGAMGMYLIYSVGGRELGGMFTKPKDMPAPPGFWFYIMVSDLDATIACATSKGAKLMNGPMSVPGGARIAQLSDPQGARFALHENPKT